MVMIRKMKNSGIEWIGEIPEGWSIAQLKRFVIVNNGREIENEIYRSDSAIPVYGSGGVFKYTDSFMYDGKSVLFGRKGTLGKPLYVEGQFWTVDTMYFLTFKGGLHPKYNYYQLRAFDWEPHITKTALPSVVASEIVSCSFPFPSLPEQQKIADFLDAECARIDAVIEQTRASIEEYKKLKQSVITQAVTKGIHPGRKMKDSGVEWIGKIPVNWRFTKTLNCLSMPITDGPHTTPELFDDGIAFISAEAVSCGNGRIDFSHKRGYISQEFYEECCKKYIPEIDDIYMIKSGATTGRVSMVDTLEPTFTIWSPLAVFRCNREMMAPRFLYYALQSKGFQKQVEFGWTFGTQQNIGMRTLEQLKVCVPPDEEQKEIIEYLDEKCAEIERLVSAKQQLVVMLESYKKSLIFEYVTGKREVK